MRETNQIKICQDKTTSFQNNTLTFMIIMQHLFIHTSKIGQVTLSSLHVKI